MLGSNNEFPSVLFDEQASDVTTPAAGFWRAYFKAGGLYIRDSAGVVTGPLTAADLAAHLADTSAAHDASAISADSTTLVGVGTDVQAVLEELDNGIADHLADTSAAHAASAVSYAGGTGMSATDVEAAIDELATEKANLAGGTFTGDISVPDEAYDATAWNGSLEVPTKNAVRDKIEALGGGGAIRVEDEGSSIVAAATGINFAGSGVVVTDAGSNEALVTIAGGGGTPDGSLLAYAQATTSATYSTSSTTDADVDATNLVVTFTVPASGRVMCNWSGLCDGPTSNWTVRESTTTLAECTIGNVYSRPDGAFIITGLTPGASKTYKWGFKRVGAGTHNIYTGGAGGSAGNAIMRVIALP